MVAVSGTDQKRDVLVERLMQSVSGVFDIFTMYLGERLGLYRALAAAGPSTTAELAARTGTYERYVREWLEQQTVVGVLEVNDPAADPAERRYQLPAGHDEVLVERDSANYMVPVLQAMVGTVSPLSAVLD